jgi:hypothetical protein
MADEENEGQGDAGADLTADERAFIQQTRNMGVAPSEVMERAQKQVAAETAEAKKTKPAEPSKAAAAEPITREEMVRQTQYAANVALAERDMQTTLKGVVEEYPALKGDAVELRQIEMEAANTVRARADYATLKSADKLSAAFAEAAKAECERRVKKFSAVKATEDRKRAEDRLDKQGDAVDSGKGEGRSDRPNLGNVSPDVFDEAVFGTEAKWPTDEAAFVNEQRRGNVDYVNKKMGRAKK